MENEDFIMRYSAILLRTELFLIYLKIEINHRHLATKCHRDLLLGMKSQDGAKKHLGHSRSVII